MGFEPTISCVTGRRALQAAPRGQDHSVAQVGVEPTASLVLSEGGLPIAYRAASVAQSESRTRNRLGLSQAARPIGVPGRKPTSRPGGTRTLDRHLVRVLPSPLGHGTRTICRAEAVGLEPTSAHQVAACFRDRFLIRPDDFRALPYDQFRGLESNQPRPALLATCSPKMTPG